MQSCAYAVASLTPLQAGAGRGARQPSPPTRGAADGTPSFTAPDARPLSVLTGAAASVAASPIESAGASAPRTQMVLILPPGPSERLADDRQLRVQLRLRVGSHPDVERLRLLDPLALERAPVAQLVGAEREAHRLRLARLQRQAPEALELAHRPRGASGALVDVELDDLVPRHRAAVRHVDGDGCGVAQLQLRRGELQVGKRERRVAQAVAERVERRRRALPVARA